MAVTATFLVSTIVTAALRKIRVVAKDEAAPAADMTDGVFALNLMLKSWQRKEYLDWTITSGTKTLTTAASYTLSPVRPIRILNARYTDTAGTQTPMQELTREEYDALPVKTSQGIPTCFYYDRQKEAALLYVWPVLASATTESISYTYERELEDIADAGDTIDMPVEWLECVIYNLGSRLASDYNRTDPKVDGMAGMLLDELLAENNPPSVFFYGDR